MRDQNTTDKSIQYMRAGWTVIELIFIIVVIGRLASIAIPKLAAVRDDAKLSADVSNMAICIRDASAQYTATRIDYNDVNNSIACDNVVCYDIIYAINGINFNVDTNLTAADYCANIENVGGHLAKRYDFGGQSIKR